LNINEKINNNSTSGKKHADLNYQPNQSLIYYLDDDVTSYVLTENLNSYGLTVVYFRDPVIMLNKIRDQPPSLVILSSIISNHSESWVLNLCNQLSDIRIKTFIFSTKNDFDCRLAAVRAGASAFVLKTIEVPALVNMIKSELNLLSVRPPNVLLVDDQESILSYYSNILAAAGMKVDISNNPLDVLERMEKVRPDILILDINMPIVKGNELAAVIRQFPEYQSIPILFLSAEGDNKTLLLEIGSDDLLQKGMPVAELVRQIKSRVDRARILSSFMFEDSLTGLLNHAQIQLAAEKNVSLANRHKRPCSIVMIDLDNFKSINDTWGHQAGDKVIKATSQLLKQRLRNSDLMGRYGGEEFMLILPETEVNTAGRLVNELRKSFEIIEFNEGTNKFNVTFSAGISEGSHGHSAKELIRKADEALYRAKSDGKNKVCMSFNKIT
jgi:diguanylate cyclase (GGDEF)-like protein